MNFIPIAGITNYGDWQAVIVIYGCLMEGLAVADEYLELPNVTVRLFIRPGDLLAAEARLHMLKGGDRRVDVAAAIAVAAGYAQGYRIEYSEADDEPPVAAVAVRRSPFSGWHD